MVLCFAASLLHTLSDKTLSIFSIKNLIWWVLLQQVSSSLSYPCISIGNHLRLRRLLRRHPARNHARCGMCRNWSTFRLRCRHSHDLMHVPHQRNKQRAINSLLIKRNNAISIFKCLHSHILLIKLFQGCTAHFLSIFLRASLLLYSMLVPKFINYKLKFFASSRFYYCAFFTCWRIICRLGSCPLSCRDNFT